MAKAGRAVFFDDAGYLVSAGWDTIDFPNLGDANACALEICSDSMEPVYREGDIGIVSPNAAVLPGDRAVAKTSVSEVRLASINAAHSELVLLRAEVV